jgi:hypothetical protein
MALLTCSTASKNAGVLVLRQEAAALRRHRTPAEAGLIASNRLAQVRLDKPVRPHPVIWTDDRCEWLR